MDAPPIRYVQTPDHFSIACCDLGQGEAVVDMGTPPFSHLQLEWEMPEIRSWYELIAQRHRFIRFDGRGTGLSERNIENYSVEAQVEDLAAVVEKMGLREFTLIGSINSGAAAIMYATQRPDHVKRLILWCAYARGSEFFEDTGTRALRGIVDQDWHMFSEAAARARFGWTHEAFASRFASLIRAAVKPEVQAALMDALRRVDVSDCLPLVACPTLVMQREDRGIAVARRMTRLIPDARLLLFKGGSAAPYLTDADEIWRSMSDFIEETPGQENDPLSPRELDVLRLVAAGKRNHEIAIELFISVRTVERHLANLYTKTGLHSKAQATAYAHRHGLI